ncbi:hypothetical protein Csa_023639, partial [Cucumis sativus]
VGVCVGCEFEGIYQFLGNNVFHAATVNNHLTNFPIDCALNAEKGISLKMSFSLWGDKNTLKYTRKLVNIIWFQKVRFILIRVVIRFILNISFLKNNGFSLRAFIGKVSFMSTTVAFANHRPLICVSSSLDWDCH